MSPTGTTNHPYPAPDGILIGHLTPGTEAWEEARTGLTITATEIAAVVGLSPWMSPFTLWHKKSGLAVPPFDMTPAIEWGTRLEAAVAEKWEEERDGLIALEAGTWQHHERTWQRATPDRLVYTIGDNDEIEDVPERADELLEVKTSPFGDDWGPDQADDGVPIHYRCQAMWQMDVTGLRRTNFAVLIGGWDYREYTVDYDFDEAKLLRDAAEQFLDDVRNEVRPPIDGATDTYQTLRAQPLGREDVDVEIDLELAARYEVAQIQAKAADRELTEAKSRVLDEIGNGYRATCNERRIAYRTVNADGTTRALMPYRSKDAA